LLDVHKFESAFLAWGKKLKIYAFIKLLIAVAKQGPIFLVQSPIISAQDY